MSRKATHDFRIAVRQLLAVLKLLGVQDLRRCEKAQKKLARAFRAAGRLRDGQVGAEALASLEPLYPVAGRIRQSLLKATPARAKRFERRLKACAVAELTSAADESDRALAQQARDGRIIDDSAARILADAQAELDHQGEAVLVDPEARELHVFRVRLKCVRYMTEWLRPIMSAPQLHRYVIRLGELQALLGAIADTRALLEALDRWASRRPDRTVACQPLRDALTKKLHEQTAAFMIDYRRSPPGKPLLASTSPAQSRGARQGHRKHQQ